MSDLINEPSHYTQHPSGLQPIEIARECSYNIGTAIVYIWRHEHKGNPSQDLRKAAWHLKNDQGNGKHIGPGATSFNREAICKGFSHEIANILRVIWSTHDARGTAYNTILRYASELCEAEADRLESLEAAK